MHVTWSGLLAHLKDEGCQNAEDHIVRHALKRGRLGEVEKDASGKYIFRKRHVEQAKRYLADIPRPGPRSK